MDPSLQAAWVAVVGALIGAIIGGGMQAWMSRNAVRAARNDAAEQRMATAGALKLQLAEERFGRLWAERRVLYTRVLTSGDLWHKANLDVRGLELQGQEWANIQMESATMRAAESISPEITTAIRAMYEFGQLAQEVKLLSDKEVREAVEGARDALREELRCAANGSECEGGPDYGAVLSHLTAAMRRELIHGTKASK